MDLNKLSIDELEELTSNSVDPSPFGKYVNRFDNVDLTDEALINKIKERNEEGKPTYKLRMEYQRRLDQRG